MDSVPADNQGQDGIRVLLVDDQRIIGEAIKRMLDSERDIVFHHCSEPSEACKAVEAFRPSVILQDLVMPGVDGMDLVRLYREGSASKGIPVIVLSSEEDNAIKLKAYSLGADDYMVKVPNRVELVAKIRGHARSRLAHLRLDDAMTATQSVRDSLESASWLDAVCFAAAAVIHDLETPVQYIVGNMMFTDDAFRAMTRFRASLAKLPMPPEIAAAVKDAADKEELDYLLDDAPKAFIQSQIEMGRVSSIVGMLRLIPLEPGAGRPKPLDVNALLREAVFLLKERLAAVSAVKLALADGLPKIQAGQGQFLLAVTLLLVGSAAAMKGRFGGGGKGLLEIASSLEDGHVTLSFSDNGSPVGVALAGALLAPVMPKPHARHGLHAVRSIMEDVGASFELKPSEESGCVIVLRFPVPG